MLFCTSCGVSISVALEGQNDTERVPGAGAATTSSETSSGFPAHVGTFYTTFLTFACTSREQVSEIRRDVGCGGRPSVSVRDATRRDHMIVITSHVRSSAFVAPRLAVVGASDMATVVRRLSLVGRHTLTTRDAHTRAWKRTRLELVHLDTAARMRCF